MAVRLVDASFLDFGSLENGKECLPSLHWQQKSQNQLIRRYPSVSVQSLEFTLGAQAHSHLLLTEMCILASLHL
jgi:hypothetical protein